MYVYLQEDNGNGRPNHNNGGQVTTLTKNGYNHLGPVTGVNKYTVRDYTRPVPFNAGSVHLDANTRYWVYIWAGNDGTTAALKLATTGSESGATGWTIGDFPLVRPEGSAYSSYTQLTSSVKMLVEGKTNPEVLVSIADVTVTEGIDGTADFVVSLNRAAKTPVRVSYSTNELTGSSAATEGSDYEARSGTLTFAPGETSKTVSVPILDDTVNEDAETFELELSNLTGAAFTNNKGIGTISADPLTVSIKDASATEGVDETIDFVVSLSRPATTRVTVNYGFEAETADFNDVVTPYGTATFEPGESETTISIVVVDDGVNEPRETFYLVLLTASGAELLPTNAERTGVGTILNTEVLTGRFENVPSEHDGSSTFTFNVEFNNDIRIGYADMREHAFTVTNGDVTNAHRNNGQSDSWKITVKPDGNDPVTVTLPGHRACTTTGAICSKEDNPVQLTNSPAATIAGPREVEATTPTLNIAGGSGKEGDDDEIDFTVTLDEAASGTVTVSYATSDGTADAGDDYTAKSGTLSVSAGATSKTISVSIEDDIENESDETFTVTLSNPSGADLGTATATGTIRNRRVEPLTASFSGMPTEHDGSEFTFDLEFSENVEAGFRKIRDRAFSLDDADITRAQRKNPQSADKNKAWTITVKPDGNEALTITLPETTSCTSNRGICTGDERKLSHSTSATVQGPVGISVSDIEVEEGAGVVLAFQVALTRAASSALTVDYATSDGSATAGADYTATSGTLTIGAGDSSGTVEVPVIDDEHNEGSETFTLTLSNASSGALTDASATGTITNHDALPAALVARFGRTAAVHVVDQVEERVNAPRAPGFDGRVAGRQINRDMGQDFALDFLQQLGGGYRAPAANVAAPGGGMTSSLGPQGPVASRGPMAQGSGLQRPMPMEGGLHHDAGFGLSMGGRDRVLQSSGFALNRATSSGGVLSFWSRSAQSSFYGQDGALALNGDVRSTMFGADYSKGRMITGVSLSHSRGLGSYAGVDTGRMTSAVTGLYPWIGFRASERVTVWTVAGYGAGGLLLSPGAGAPVQTGLSMALAAGGGRGELLAGDNGFELAFKADALWVGTRTDAASGPSGNLDATRAGITRLRTALEGSQSMTVGGRMAFTPSVELGIRQDGGDAEVGRGLDVGLGLVVADGVTGLGVDVRIRRLLVHQADGFEENGVSVSVSYDPTPKTPLGFTARVSPAWGGDAMSGAEALWGRETMGGMGQDQLLGGSGNRLDTEVGYGLPIGARFVGTPRVGLRTSEYGRDYRLGYSMNVLEATKLKLQIAMEAERRQIPAFLLQDGATGREQRVLGRATVEW